MNNQNFPTAATRKDTYHQMFQIAQQNLELFCEEYKQTTFCRKQRLWQERKTNQTINTSTK